MGRFFNQRCCASSHSLGPGIQNLRAQTDRDVQVIRVDHTNTVESLRDRLQSLLNDGDDDMGLPILRPSGDNDGMRLVGYVGACELEHALGMCTVHPLPQGPADLRVFLSYR